MAKRGRSIEGGGRVGVGGRCVGRRLGSSTSTSRFVYSGGTPDPTPARCRRCGAAPPREREGIAKSGREDKWGKKSLKRDVSRENVNRTRGSGERREGRRFPPVEKRTLASTRGDTPRCRGTGCPLSQRSAERIGEEKGQIFFLHKLLTKSFTSTRVRWFLANIVAGIVNDRSIR